MVKLNNDTIDYSNITFSEAKKGKDGKYFISSTVDDEEILFQMKKVISKSQITSSFDVQLTNKENIDMIQEAEDQMLALSKDHKDEWFPDQNITDEYLDTAFMSFIKPIKKSNDVNFRMRTSSRLSVYNALKEEVEYDDITEGNYASCIVQLSGIWFTKSRFGVVWKVFQVKLDKIKKTKEVCLFEDADDDEYEEMENAFPDE